MRSRYAPLTLVTSLVFMFAACGGSASSPPSAPDKEAAVQEDATEEALKDAATVCNDVLRLGEGGMPQYIATVRTSANTAAGAALDDARWDGLADSASDMAVVYDKVSGLQGSGDEAAALDQLNELMPELEAAKSDFAGECRRVLAAGGDVEESLLTTFIEPDESGFDDSLFGDSGSLSATYPPAKVNRFVKTVRDLDMGGELTEATDVDLVGYGSETCELLDGGIAEGEIALALSEEKDMSIEAAASVMTGAYIHLCS